MRPAILDIAKAIAEELGGWQVSQQYEWSARLFRDDERFTPELFLRYEKDRLSISPGWPRARDGFYFSPTNSRDYAITVNPEREVGSIARGIERRLLLGAAKRAEHILAHRVNNTRKDLCTDDELAAIQDGIKGVK